MRVFVALVLDERFKRILIEATSPICAARDELRWVSAANLHVTLSFLGEIDERGADLAEEAAEIVAGEARPFALRAAGLMAIPRRSAARVLAAAIREGSGEAAGLAAGFEASLAAIGGEAGYPFRPPENRPFTAHVTLARAGRRPIALGAEELSLPVEAVAEIGEIAVYESALSSGGATYRELARFGLGKGRVD